MKILFFHRWVGVHYGGTEIHVKSLAVHFGRRGHDVALLTRDGSALKDLSPEIKVWRIPKNFLESDFSYEQPLPLYFHTVLFMIKSFLFLLYLRFVKNERFDVLSVHFVTEAWVARLFRFIFKVPFVFVLEGYTPLEGQAARKAQAAIAISQDLADRVWRFHGFRPTVIAIGIDEGQFNLSVDGSKDREKYLGDFEKLILTVGRVEPRKDYPTLVEAARIINSLSHRYRWLIVGEGIDQEKISYLIKDKGLGQTVLMLGAVSEDEKARLYRASDLLVLPTLYEGFGIVFVEAMACGLPVVSTLVGAVPEVVDGAGLLVEPKKPELLAKAVTEVLENKGLYKTLASKALLAAQRYNWDRLVVEYEKVYQKVIKYV